MSNPPLPSLDMVIDAVDVHDNPVGTIVRRRVLKTGTNFRVSHLFVFNSKGELLIQQLSSLRERHRGLWGSSVAAYLFAGETYEQAIERRLQQELGREIPRPVQLIGHTEMLDGASEKFIALFRVTDDGPFPYDRQHIEQVEFLAPAVISELIATGERPFTPTFLHLFAFYTQVTATQA